MVYQKHICLLVTEDDKDIIGYDDSVGASIKERFRSVCGDALRFSTYEVVRGHFPTVIDEFDGYLVTGSHYCANDNLPWMLDLEEFLRQARKIPHIRIFGTCFGHQFIAKSFGGRVARNPSNKYIFSCGKVDVSPEFTAKSYFQSALCNRENFFIMQSHNDQVVVKPNGCTTMGWSPGCPYEILSYGDNVLTMQGHPEISVDRMENITIPMVKSKGMITDLEERKVRKSLINDNGDELMTLIANFLRNC